MSEYKILIAGYEKPFFISNASVKFDKNHLAQEAVYKSGLKSPYGKEETRNVKIFSLRIENGELKESLLSSFSAILPEENPNQDQFLEQQQKILSEIPEEFHGFVSSEAWDRGHASGYREILNIAGEIVYSLKPSIEAYKKALTEHLS